jgi:hypothetical protein
MDEIKKPDQQNHGFEQKALRTYESDIADAIQDHSASQVSISIAETKRKEKREEVEESSDESINQKRLASSMGKNMILVGISVVLIASGAFGAYYLYTLSPLAAKQTEVQNTGAQSLVKPNFQKVIDITGKNPTDIVSAINDERRALTITQGNMLELVFAERPSSTTKTFSRVGGPEFITKVGLTPPDIFLRSLTFDWMLGFYNDGTGGQPFIILTTNFFQNAYAGLLKWEPLMPDDLASVININTPSINSSGASTSIDSYFTLRGKFEDSTVQNKDVRQFKDQNGNVRFVYSLIDNKTIIIAHSVSTLTEIVRRIEEQTYVR